MPYDNITTIIAVLLVHYLPKLDSWWTRRKRGSRKKARPKRRSR